MAAEQHTHGDYHRGDMAIQEQVHTYHLFILLAKWGSLATAVALIFLILWFCTTAGFLGALVTGIVVLAVGIGVLRDRSAQAH
jgi:hypothetical protein